MAYNDSRGSRGPREDREGREDGGRGGSAGGPRRRRTQVRTTRVCAFCVDKVKEIDYKQTDTLKRYITDRGQIRPRRKTGLCAKHQRRIAESVKRARFMALLPYTGEHVRLYG